MNEPHLWEVDHPSFGAEGELVEFETLDELIQHVNAYGGDLNHIYRWDWDRPDPLDYDELEPMPDHDTLTLFVVMPRKSRLTSWSAPVTEADEAKVREFLTSDRVLGEVKATWEPLL